MLPVFVPSKLCAFQAELNGKYLQSGYRKREGGSRIEASAGTFVANTRTRFLVQPSKQDEGLMHVQCCYNNKYWVPVLVQDSGSSCWIIGTADESEEDLSSPSCTLFKPLPVKDKHNSIRLINFPRLITSSRTLVANFLPRFCFPNNSLTCIKVQEKYNSQEIHFEIKLYIS
jgi:hypothetical protein